MLQLARFVVHKMMACSDIELVKPQLIVLHWKHRYYSNKPVKRFQMDVGMSSIQAFKVHKQEGTLVSKVHKQGTLGTSSKASLHQWLHCMSNNQVFFNLKKINLELISISYNYHAATDVGMLEKMCRVSLVCAPCLPVFLLVCVL